MKLTTRSEYALLALIHLCRQDPDTFVSVDAIARAQSIPVKYLEQILLAMKRARLVRSAKGQRGGYQLVNPADQITLAEVIRLFDGPLASTASTSEYFYAPTPIERERRLLGFFKEIRDMVAKRMESVTIADVQ
ncbi:MAG: Rrf2 family transcriptional regulator [Bryobacteraceae bacterium]|jgi:Rrf2 family protein